jgi:hypothetical protein
MSMGEDRGKTSCISKGKHLNAILRRVFQSQQLPLNHPRSAGPGRQWRKPILVNKGRSTIVPPKVLKHKAVHEANNVTSNNLW